jgi:hypothetical protein
MKPVNDQALNAVTTSTNSTALHTTFQLMCSVQAVATGTIAGTVKIQFSNDAVPLPALVTNWNDIPSATITLTGTPGPFAIPQTNICYEWVRVVFTSSGGAGTVTANYKSIGY